MTGGWVSLRDDDEDIPWQGTPAVRVTFEWPSARQPFVFPCFIGFSIFWVAMAAPGSGQFWMFGLLFFGIAIHTLILTHVSKAHGWRHSDHTQTTKQAFTASKSPWGRKSLQSDHIDPAAPLGLIDGPGPTLTFAAAFERADGQSPRLPIAFKEIAGGRKLYENLRQAQAKAA